MFMPAASVLLQQPSQSKQVSPIKRFILALKEVELAMTYKFRETFPTAQKTY